MSKPHIVNACFVGSLGLADYTMSLARALSAHARSTIVTAQSFAYPHVSFDGEVVRIFRRTRHYFIDIWRFMLRMLKMRPDVLVFQAPLKYPLLDAFVARRLRARGIRVATTVHDVLPHYPRPWSKQVYRIFYRSFDRLIAHSEAARAKLIEMGIAAPVLVVPHGVYDLYRLTNVDKATARKRIGLPGDETFLILFFGKVDERKGIAELLDAADRIDEATRVRFVIAGADGISAANTELRQRFDAACASSRFSASVRRIPFEDVENYFAAVDAVVLPYLEGTTSGVLKLAMAFGKPVIATDVGDVPETVTPDAGLVISHNRIAEELPEAISRLQADYPKYLANWSAVGDKYSWRSIGGRYFEFLTTELPPRT